MLLATWKKFNNTPKIYILLFFNELYLSIMEFILLGAGCGSAEFSLNQFNYLSY